MWHPESILLQASLSPTWLALLCDPGSFIQHLATYGQVPDIYVLAENWLVQGGEKILKREVLIHNALQQWMYAETLIPEKTIACEENLSHLETRSLGSILFKDPTLKRSPFEFCLMKPPACWAMINTQEPVWARRSIFHVKNQPLQLTEYFLPDLNLLMKSNL